MSAWARLRALGRRSRPARAEGPVRVLYVSYTGLLEPLGESQVLQYLVALGGDHDVTLLTYERADDLANSARVEAMEARCEEAGIRWIRLRYHKTPSVPATLYDLAVGAVVSAVVASVGRVEVVHARSYVPGVLGLLHQRLGRRFVFDMRGFWPDERVDGGIWRAGSRRYRAAKVLERRLLSSADVVVSLTEAGVREMRRFDYLRDRDVRFEVIPTCTNLDVFRPEPPPPDRAGFTLGYVGSAGVWYLFPETAACVRELFRIRPDARLLVVNRSEHDYVRATLAAAGVDLSRVEIRAARYDEVAHQIARMDAAIYFLKPVFSKRASCPTKLGELLACGKPVLTNAGVGDVDTLLARGRCGVALGSFDTEALGRGISELLQLAEDPEVRARCMALARSEFSLETGVRRYESIWRSVSGRG